MRKPKLGILEKELQKGKSFTLTDEQYLSKTGADFPKNRSYARTKSAVAKLAHKHGYIIRIIPKQIHFIKEEQV